MKNSSRFRFSILTLGVSFVSLISGCGGGGSDGGGSGGGGSDGGGSDGGTNCGKVQPCGGNVVGSWKLASACSEVSSIALGIAECPTARVDSASTKLTGTASFTAAGTYSVLGSTDMSMSFTLPADCLTAQGGAAAACPAANEKVQADVGAAATYQSGSCVVTGADCSCSVVFNSQAIDEAGTYSTAGTALTTTPIGATADSADYCVQGSSLHMIQVDATMTMGAMGTVKVLSDTVLTKS